MNIQLNNVSPLSSCADAVRSSDSAVHKLSVPSAVEYLYCVSLVLTYLIRNKCILNKPVLLMIITVRRITNLKIIIRAMGNLFWSVIIIYPFAVKEEP